MTSVSTDSSAESTQSALSASTAPTSSISGEATDGMPAEAAPVPTFDRDAARQHCLLLARGNPAERFVFQSFADRKEDKNNKALVATYYGTLDDAADWLTTMNAKQAGIFVTVNRTRGAGRSADDIEAVRAVFADHDEKDGPMKAAPTLPCSLVIRSGHGTHYYYLLGQPASPAVFTPMQEAIASYLGTDDSVCDLPRVMRLAGSINWKVTPVQVVLVECHPERTYTIEAVARAYRVDPATLVAKQRTERTSIVLGEPTADHRRIRELCPWFNHLFTHPQDIKEREWFAGLKVVGRCVDAESVAHEMSSGHTDYTQAETAAKLERARQCEPTPCAVAFKTFNFFGCATCPNFRKGGGPADLGQPSAASSMPANVMAAATPSQPSPATSTASEAPETVAEAAVVALESNRPQDFLRSATFAALADLDADHRDQFILRIRAALRGNRAMGITKKDVDQRLDAAIRARDRAQRRQGQDDLPTIQVNDAQLRDVSDATMQALADANDQDPKDFVRCGKLARIIVNPDDNLPSAEEHKMATLRGRLSRVANFERDEGDRGIRGCAPPNDLVEELLHRGQYPELLLLNGITTAPIARPDGTFHTIPGYDRETGLFLAPTGDPVAFALPRQPTPEDVANAKQALFYVFQDFPFVGDASMVHVIALLLTMLLRPVFKECVPMFVIRASSPGTGKSLIVEVCALIVYGMEHLSVFSPAESNQEMRKLITTALMEARPIIAVDNVVGLLDHEALAALVTSGSWSDRKLGGNTSVNLQNRAVVTVTGNNIRTDADQARRLVLVDLRFDGENPAQRTGFAVPHLKRWVRERREELLAALLVLVANWHALGRPAPRQAKPFGSFELWQETVGGIIEAAGITGFRCDEAQMETLNDGLAVQWGGFLRAIHLTTWGLPFRVSDLADRIPDARSGNTGIPELEETLPGSIAARHDRGQGSLNHALGQGFKTIQGMTCQGFTLMNLGLDLKSKVGLWRVRASNLEDVAEPARSGLRFLDLLRTAGWWKVHTVHTEIDDGRLLSQRCSDGFGALLNLLPELPAPGAAGFEEALRSWARHFLTVTNRATPEATQLERETATIVALVIHPTPESSHA